MPRSMGPNTRSPGGAPTVSGLNTLAMYPPSSGVAATTSTMSTPNCTHVAPLITASPG